MSHLTTCIVFFLLAFVTYTYQLYLRSTTTAPTPSGRQPPVGGEGDASSEVRVGGSGPHQVLKWHVYGVVLIATSMVPAEVGVRPVTVVGSWSYPRWGRPPNTLAEYALNQFSNLDFWDISVIDGFNIPMSFGPTKPRPENVMEFNARPI
ncbi:hypothetical protein HAX54_041335 [Datura stramonium]|uniref:Uncharacterized protein n=1 Tax=Datura stramonium TaxID=4076 RepID=A0ABS8SKY5_DATST|nr:hypothetical protein [Datura stramonium]